VESLEVRDRSAGLRGEASAGGLALAMGLALCVVATHAAAQIQVVSAGAEYQSFHPRPAARAAVSGEGFHATMDRVFGAGRWRLTSAYRSQAQENALRRQGAGTVAPGHTSLHSVGGPEAPGAYDAVVDHMPLGAAAEKLRRAGGGFSRVVAEGAHGPQGAHLHVELISTAARRAAPQPAAED
jgi:hypothetical protein